MKKIIILFSSLFLILSTFAQKDSTKTKTSYYASLGLSISHVNPNDNTSNTFRKASYPSVELGLMRKNVSLGVVVGDENMLLLLNSSRKFYELKTSISYPIGNCSGYALFGTGAYFEKGYYNFIEYGAGFSYAPKNTGYFVQYSNWATMDYITVGFVYNLN